MATAPTQDFIVKSGLNVQGTSTVTSSTGNTSTLQVDGGAAIAKNLIVGEDAVIYGDLTIYGSLPFLSITTGTFTNLTVSGLSTLNGTTLGITTAGQLTVNSRLAVGGLSELNNATLSNQTNSTSSTTGALQVSGGVGIQKDLWVGGRAWVNGFEVITTATIIASTLQAVAEQGSSTTIAISILNTVSSTSTDTGALTVVGGVGVGGAVYAGAVYDSSNRVVTSVVASGSTYIGIVNLISTGTSTSFEVVNLGVQTLTAGTDTVVSSNTGTILVWNTSTLESISSRGSTTTNAIHITNATPSTSTTTGALIVNGGVGIGGALYVNELYITTSSYVDNSLLITTATIVNFAATSITAGTDTAVSTSTGAILIWNTSTLQSITDRGSQTSNAVAISNNTPSTSSVTGALTVDGGVGIDQDLYVGGTIYGTLVGSGIISTATNIAGGTAGQVPYQTAPGVTNFYGPGTAGNILVSNGAAAPTYNNTLTLASTLSNTTTVAGNALQVIGGVGIDGSLFVHGPAYFQNNVVFSGTSTSILSTTTVYTDNYIELHFPVGGGEAGVWTVDDGKDIGHIYHHYKDATGDEHGALIWHNLSDELRWYMGGLDLNTSTQVWEVNNATYGAFRTGSILLEHTTAATSTTTGTLVVVGGVGIGGGIYVGGAGTFTNTISATSATFSGTLSVTGRSTLGVLNATSATFSGTLGVTGTSVLAGLQASNIVASGTLGVTGTSILAGLTTVTNTTSATSTSTGAFQVRGGVGIGGALYAQQTSYINGSQILTVATIGSFGVSTITAGTDTVVSSSTGSVLIWNTSTLQSITNRGAVTTNQLNLNNGVNFGSTANFPVAFNGNYTNANGTFIIANGFMVGTTTTTALYALNFQHNLAPISTATISSYYGNLFLPTLQNTATYGSMYGTFARIDIGAAATSGTVGTWYGFFSATPSRNAAGNVPFTNHIGFYAQDPSFTITATNVIGVQSVIASGTNRYNIYASGTADNFFNGNVGIGVLPTVKLDVVGATKISGITTITNNTEATSTITGALQVIGGVGIGRNLYVGGTSNLQGVTATNIVALGTLGVTGTSTLGVLNATSATFSGTLGVTGTRTLGVLNATSATFSGTLGVTGTSTLGVLNATLATFSGVTNVTNTTAATSTSTGALQVRGGVGIGGALYVQETSYVNGSQILTAATIANFGVSTITAGTDTRVSTSTGVVVIWNTSTLQSVTDRGAATTNAVSITNTTSATNTTTGALQVRGGVGVGGSVYVGNRVGFVGTNSASVVYQVYNAATNSLDTVFG
jgi:hypothetical protein